MSLSSLFEKVRREAIQVYLDVGVLIPRVYCLRGDNIQTVIPLLFESDDEKQTGYEQIFRMADQHNINGFIDASESWMAEDLKPGDRPRDSANRKEVVIMFGRQIKGGRFETLMHMYEIVRYGGGVDLVRSKEEPTDPNDAQVWFDPYLEKKLKSN